MFIKLFFIFICSLFVHSMQLSAYDVPVVKQKKNILLEEFTGVKCGNCPDGHVVANTLLCSHPDNVYVVAIHAGTFANFSNFDLRVKEGIELHDYFKAYEYGYPGGMVNRRNFSRTDLLVMGRGSWIKSAKEIHQEMAPVNLLLKSTFNADTREINLELEGYWTKALDEGSIPRVSILWTQNNIYGPQNGGNDGDYCHEHVLRGYISSVLGDTLEYKKSGEFFTKSYSFVLPKDINGIEVCPKQIEIIAFVTSDEEVLNVIGGKPIYKNYKDTIMASISPAKIPIGNRYGYKFFELNLENQSNEAIDSACFGVVINDENFLVEWKGYIAPFSSEEITLEIPDFTFLDQNEYSIELQSLNGQSVETSVIQGFFAEPIVSSTEIVVSIKTDLYADENTYCLKDLDGNLIRQFGPYSVNVVEEYEERINLDPDKMYCFEVLDEWGDGISQGYLKIHSDNKLIAQEYNIRGFGCRSFFMTNNINSIDKVSCFSVAYDPKSRMVHISGINESAVDMRLYDLCGKEVFAVKIWNDKSVQLPSDLYGIYLLQCGYGTESNNMKLYIK